MKYLAAILLTLGSTIACAKQVRPGDMSAAAHRRECASHKQAAADAQLKADQAARTEYPKARYPHLEDVKRETRIAEQHASAVKQLEPGTPVCD